MERGSVESPRMTSAVEVKRFDRVDARFAWDEGEGDRTLETWRAGHRRYFTRQCAGWGDRVRRTHAVVFERFELVWPDRPLLR